MSILNDQRYLREKQYRTDDNLRARIDLHRRFSVEEQPWHRWVFDRLELESGARMLEVGCGPAELWRENRDRIDPSWSLTLTDFSEGMIDVARSVLGDRAEYAVVDAQDIPYPDEAFDVVIANHMLYHVPDRSRAFGEIARVLAAGGRLYAATIGREHMLEIGSLVMPAEEWASFSEEFGLESGEEQLARFFADVRLELHSGHLEVTETEPLLAYIRSAARTEGLADEQLRPIRTRLEETIARVGSFRIERHVGLFTCRKP